MQTSSSARSGSTHLHAPADSATTGRRKTTLYSRVFLAALFSSLLCFAATVAAQDDPCRTKSTSLNTGADHVGGGLHPIGAAEPFWTVTGDPDPGTTEPRPAAVIQKHPAWSQPLPGTQWISSYPSAADDRNGFYDFSTRFCLADGWSNAVLQISLRADDRATVFLNNQQIGATPAAWSFNSAQPTTIQVVNQSLFVSGVNTLLVRVENTQSVAMGLNLAGQVTADGLAVLEPECCQRGSSISGRKFHDEDGDGTQDPGEPGLDGWTVVLSNAATTLTAVTDSNGYYYFLNVAPGVYTVAEQQVAGWEQTAPASGTYTAQVGQAQALGGLDFGNKPDCLEILRESLECTGGNSFTYTFTVQNHSTEPAQYIVFHDLPPGVTILPGDVITLPALLLPGQTTTLTVNIVMSGEMDELCFRLAAHSESFEECCMVRHCVAVPHCCGVITEEHIKCDPEKPGLYHYQFTYVNLSAQPVTFIQLASTNNCFSSVTLTLSPPLAPGQSTNLVTSLQVSPKCGPELCFLVTATTKDFSECCAFMHCVTLPQCCGERTYTLNADFNEGILVNVTYAPVADQLQFNAQITPLPFVNIAASGRGTAVRIDVNTGQVLGEYWTSPDNMGRDPSRTTVDQFGNVWVANRAEGSGGMGSVTKIALVIGGTRGDKIGTNFVANPAGQYLAPPYTYNTALDKDGDGLLKTSFGLGNILPWNNAGGVDSNGGVTTAEDELITFYVRTTGSGARALAIDANNDLWTGGLIDRDHEKIDGSTGLPVPGTQFNTGWGGYGALIGVDGALWSAQPLMRFTPNPLPPPAGVGTYLEGITGGSYGLGVDPCNGHVWVDNGWQNGQLTLFEFDAAGNVLNTYPQPFWTQGLAVDGNGHVWVAQGFGSQVWHLAPNPIIGQPHVVVGIVTGFQGVTGLAVDSNGKIWAAERTGNRASAIDPTLGPIGGGGYTVGAIDTGLIVNLGPGALPYNYSDMTGMVAIGATQPLGFWTVVHDGGFPGINWGTVSWNSSVPPGSSIVVEVRAADAVGALASQPFTEVGNGASFCNRGIIGRFIEIRVKFLKPSACEPEGPILYDLTVACCESYTGVNNPPMVFCPEPIEICEPKAQTLTLTAQVADPEGDSLLVTWLVDGSPVETDQIPTGTPNTLVNVTLNYTFTPGQHTVAMVVTDASGNRARCETTVTIGDHSAPEVMCPPGERIAAFEGRIPDFTSRVEARDACPGELKIQQAPPAGTVVGQGIHAVTITVTDAAGNTATCQTFYAVQPIVQITDPRKYDIFAPGTSVTVRVVPVAGIQPGIIRSVELFLDAKLAGVDAESPYEFTIGAIPEGDHRLVAVAVNDRGLRSSSDSIFIFARGSRGAAVRPVLGSLQQAGDKFAFQVQTRPGEVLHIEYTEGLGDPEWKLLRTVTSDSDQYTVTDAYSTAAKFYRVRVDSTGATPR